MATKRAKTFTDGQLSEFLAHVDQISPMPIRDRLIIALSFKAGLRVGEIGLIKIDAMLDVRGNIAKTISVFSDVGKMRRERQIPMNKMVRDALVAFRKAYPNAEVVAISSQPFRWTLARGLPIPPTATFRQMSVKAVKNHYQRLLDSFGHKGASTHSGRRTFGTTLARTANQHHCSLRDVQMLLGHSRLETTEAYVELSPDASKLVLAL